MLPVSSFAYLVQSHTKQKKHNVKNFVQGHFAIEADNKEHDRADVNPVFYKHPLQRRTKDAQKKVLRIVRFCKRSGEYAEASSISSNRSQVCSKIKPLLSLKKLFFFLTYYACLSPSRLQLKRNAQQTWCQESSST